MLPTPRRSFRSARHPGAAALAAVVLLLALAVAAGAEQKSIVILHTNDVHGHILPSYDFRYPGEPKPRVGGYARLSGVVRRVRAEAESAGKGFLLLDAGDVFDGTPEGLRTRGKGMVELMNLIGYDAMTVGNHEFAHGVEALREMSGAARFPFLACNLVAEDGSFLDWIKPVLVKEVAGLRVAVVGVVTASTPEMNFAENVRGVRFLPTEERVRACLEYVDRQVKPDIRFVLSHVSSQSDAALARANPSVPLFIGGHDHVVLEAGMRRGNALICQAGDHLLRVGRIDLVYDTETRRIVSLEASLINLGSDAPEPDPAVAALVETIRAKEYDEPVGRCDVSCVPGRDQESRVGNLVTDAMRARSKAEVALMNSGGVRSGLVRGEVTRRHLFDIAPFPDEVRVYRLRGEELRSLLENGAPPSGGFRFEVSGIAFDMNPLESEGRRVGNLRIGGAAFDPRREYSVAVSSFFAQHGVRRAFFAGKEFSSDRASVYDCLVDYFASTPEVQTRPPGAIVLRKEKPSGAAADRININEADAIALTRLPGIGEVLAARIVEYRAENGPFRDPDELLRIKGLSEAVLSRIRDRITLD